MSFSKIHISEVANIQKYILHIINSGVEEKAEYLKDLGIGTVWLSPIFKSPMADMGYDISDFKSVDPIFGTMNDFESLRDKLHTLGE